MLAPASRGTTWYLWQDDVQFIDAALAWTFQRLNVDPAHLALGGFSDGASIGLSLGIANGQLFPEVLGFSPGYLGAVSRVGKPRIFISHGRQDAVLPFGYTADLVNRLRSDGYNVTFVPFDGGHDLSAPIGRQAWEWLLGKSG